jgi:NTP pyrophosphatase (non-canonical NTP hydrolase)
MYSPLKELADQCYEDSQRWFPETADDVFFMVASMMGEAGEAFNEVKKTYRLSHNFSEQKDKILEECADTMVYMLNIFGMLGEDPQAWYDKVHTKNEARFGVISRNDIAREHGATYLPEEERVPGGKHSGDCKCSMCVEETL